jgi:hypothetical protein
MPERGLRRLSTTHLIAPGYWLWLIQLATGPISIGLHTGMARDATGGRFDGNLGVLAGLGEGGAEACSQALGRESRRPPARPRRSCASPTSEAAT